MANSRKKSIGGNNLEVSFQNYKIDYNHPLGEGSFGAVYPIVRRPESEKIGCLSRCLTNWFPYIYDYLYRFNVPLGEPREYCVKIYKSIFSLGGFPEHISSNEVHSQPSIEQETNAVLRKYKLSHIQFFKTSGIYSQFKTLVQGKTFSFYLENKSFIQKEQFNLRKSFVDFLKSIDKPNLIFLDMLGDNIMYDERHNRWEIIDGEVREENHTSVTRNNILYFEDALLCHCIDANTESVLKALFQAARSEKHYTEDSDLLLIEKSSGIGNANRKRKIS